MKRWIVLALLLALLAAVPAGAEDDAAAWVDGVPVTQAQLDKRLSTARGGGDEADRRAAALCALIEEQALLNEASRRGITCTGDVRTDADRRYERTLDAIRQYVLSQYPDLSGDALEQTMDALLDAMAVDLDDYRDAAERSALLDALDDALAQDMPQPDDADVRARYDALYADQSARFPGDENALEAALLAGDVVVCRPVALKLIKKAEFTFDDLAQALIADASKTDAEEAAGMAMDQYRLLADAVEPIYEDLVAGRRSFDDVLEEIEPGSSAKVNYFHPSSTRFGEDYYQRADAFETVGEISTAYVIPNGYALLYYAGDLPVCDPVPLEQVRGAIEDALRAERRGEWLAARHAEILAAAEVTYAGEGQP